MRIITGSARGANIITLEGEHTRPTAERTKEALFSMLQFEIEGRKILDLFAGTLIHCRSSSMPSIEVPPLYSHTS